MRAWINHSPYRAVGIYIGGSDRACAQPNLTAGWVSQQAAAGWHFIPLYVGPQAAWGQIRAAIRQGASAADDAVIQARALGFGPGTPLYYDMEAYPRRRSRAALRFLSAWTEELHMVGYASGVYSSSNSAVADLADHNISYPGYAGYSRHVGYVIPDVIFDALWNGEADTADALLPPGDWADHQRIHQYSGGTSRKFGGHRLNIDRDYLDVLFPARELPPAGNDSTGRLDDPRGQLSRAGPRFRIPDGKKPGQARARASRTRLAGGHILSCGGGGNRTRVLQYITRASPGAACCAFLGPGGHAGKPPTGSAAVGCPGQSRGRVAQLSLLTDASHRAGGAPGLTASLLAQAARAKLVRCVLALIGLRSQY